MNATMPEAGGRTTTPSRLAETLSGTRIAYIAGTLGNGGAERQLAYVLATVESHVAEARIFCLDRGEIWEHRLRGQGFRVDWFGRSPHRTRRLLDLMRCLRDFNPHLVHCQHFYANPYAVVCGRLLNVPVVASIRNDLVSELAVNPRWIARPMLRLADRVAANSHAARELAKRLGFRDEHYRHLQNVVDTHRFRPSPRQTTQPYRLGFVGRLKPQKRPDRFLRLLRQLLSEGRAIRAVMVGEGELRPKVEAELVDLDLSEHVSLTGALDDVAEVYSRIDLLVSTSEHEGTPNTILEAMSCGLPVVGYAVGDIADLLGRRPEAVIEPFDHAMMTRRVAALIDDQGLAHALGEENRRRAESDYSLARLERDLDELYAPLLSEPMSAPRVPR